MDIAKTIEILEALASGCSPRTGEIVEAESILNERDVIRALQVAIDSLKSNMSGTTPKLNSSKRDLHRSVDFFQKDKFNNFSEQQIEELRKKVKELGILKTERLADSVIAARLHFPRAYESWSEAERELLENAMKFTNDLDLLSQCFQRGRGSVESFGQKLLYESNNITQ